MIIYQRPLILILLLLHMGQVSPQDGISYISEIKNIFGGILAVDNVHKRCLQKTICQEFSDQIVRLSPLEGVNRNGRRRMVPRVIQRRGRLRFIGDWIVRMGNFLYERGLRLSRTGRDLRNRQFDGAVSIANANFVTKGIALFTSMLKSIPSSAIISVMDFVADFTNVMSRHGAVYPFFRAASVGYGYGNHRRDDFGGVCSQLAVNCRGWWDHIGVINRYDGGTLPRKNTFQTQSYDRNGGGLNSDDPITWNQIKVKDLSSPKIFLCKAGKFLEKLSGKMGADEVVRERFGTKDFEETCNPDISLLRPIDFSSSGDDNSINESNEFDNEGDDVEILDIGRSYSTDQGIDDLPILVFEGLPKPQVDETEIGFMEKLLNSSLGLPPSSVRNAIRLPLRHGERDIVLVEMDTEDNEMTVLQQKQSVKNLKRDLGIRRARFKELWRYVEDLLAIKSSFSDRNEFANGKETEVIKA